MTSEAVTSIEMTQAVTAEAKEAVFRFRYTVYVEEMGRYRARADGATRRFAEPEDDHSWHLVALDGDRVVAATRLTWGGDGFSPRQIEQYHLAPVLAEVPASKVAVGERTMVAPELRGTTILAELVASGTDLVAEHGIELVFGACEPHLLPLYLDLGQRSYAHRNINSEEAGYLVPLASFVHGPEALLGLGDLRQMFDTGGAVRHPLLIGASQYRDEVHATLADLHERGTSPFDGLEAAAIDRCLQRSTVIECRSGDRVIKRDGSARNVFVVLDGALAVRHNERVVAVLEPGDIVGETAFLLDAARGADVDVVTDARLLSLSAGMLREVIACDAEIAAPLLANMSRALCRRLAHSLIAS